MSYLTHRLKKNLIKERSQCDLFKYLSTNIKQNFSKLQKLEFILSPELLSIQEAACLNR